NRDGHVLATVGGSDRSSLAAASQEATREALNGRETLSLLPQPDGMLQFVTVPISIGLAHPDVLGALSAGFLLDNALATQLKAVTGSDVAFGIGTQVFAATLPREYYPLLAEQLRTSGVSHVRLGDEDYVALPRPLLGPVPGAG